MSKWLGYVLTGVGSFGLGFASGYVVRDMQAEEAAKNSGGVTMTKVAQK